MATTTLTSEEIPPLLKRNHIVSGYRPLNQPSSYYFKSAFCSHNEVINVWTHFVPAVVLILFFLIPELRSDLPRVPVLVLYMGIACLLLGSSSAHLLHSRSPIDHIFWFLIDFSGIALFGVSIGLQRFACNQEMGLLARIAYLPSLLAVVLGLQFLSSCYLFVCRPHWKYRLELRMLTCLFLAIWLYIPLLHRYWVSSESEDEGLALHTKAFLWLLYSGIFMGGHVPERFAPGKFDIFGYGHQLFHLCINMLAWNLCEAADMDCGASDGSINKPINAVILGVFVLSFVYIVFVLKNLMGRAKDLKYD
ncbi:unnamed protein product [Auanema sp. JU1783]|nr:unnamed protein product [Auanema sp. JU1783]